MKLAHRLAGFGFVLVFLATGQYMRFHFPSAFQNDLGMRMMFRSAHVYILLAAILNIIAGAHLQPRRVPWRNWLQTAGSLLLLAAPAIFLAAFCLEPVPQKLSRPITQTALILSLTAASLHTLATFGDKTPQPPTTSNE